MTPPVPFDQLGMPIRIDAAGGVTPDTSANLTRDVPACGPRDVQRSRLYFDAGSNEFRTVSIFPTNDWIAIPEALRNQAQDITPALWQQIVGARGDFLYTQPLQSGQFTTFFQPVCRDANPTSGTAGDANARYRLYYADMPTLQNPPGSPALQPVPFVFMPAEIDALIDGVPISSNNYGVERSDPHLMQIFPDVALFERIREFINSEHSPIAPERQEAMAAAFTVDNFGGLRTAAGMRDEMRYTMLGMGVLQLLTTGIALGKGATLMSAFFLLPRMIVMPAVDGLINLYRLANREPVRWDYTRSAYGDAYRFLTNRGRHLATLDRMTKDATANARQYQSEYTREYTRALEDIRRTHPSMPEQQQTDRARGAARNVLRTGQFSDYVAADEMLHSIELGLRSSNADERADAQARLDRITQAENTLVQDKNSNPVFIDLKGTGKSIRMYAIVLRSVRGESSVPPTAIQRRNWRELSRQGIMGERAEYVSVIDNNVKALLDALRYFRGRGEPVGLLIDEIHSFFGDKQTDPHVMKALQLLKNEMAKNNAFGALGATTPEEYAEVTTDQAMADRLRPIRFPPTVPATMRLAVTARLLTVSPDSLSRPDIDATIARLIESSYQLEGTYSPRRVLDNALPTILSSGDFSVAGVDQYFRNEKEMRINEVVRAAVGRFEPMALQARLLDALHPGSSGGPMPDAELRQRVVDAVMEVCREKEWLALANAEGTRMVTEAFTQARTALGAPRPGNPGPVAPTPLNPAPAPRAPAPAPNPSRTDPLNRFRADPLPHGDIVQALEAMDPRGRQRQGLADAFRIISPETRPLTTVGQFLDVLSARHPDLMGSVVADLARRGVTLDSSPWQAVFEATARLASPGANGRIPRPRVADIDARVARGADFERRLGGREAEDAAHGRRPAEDRAREARRRGGVRH